MAGLLDGDIPGIDPETLKVLQAYMGLMNAQPSDLAKIDKDKWMNFGFGLMQGKKGDEWGAVGRAGMNALQQANAERTQLQLQRGQNMGQAGQLLGLARANQSLQLNNDYRKTLLGGMGQDNAPVPLPTAPYAGQGMGDRSLGSLGAPGATPNQIPAGVTGENDTIRELRDAGVSDSEIRAAGYSADPQGAVTKLLTEYRKPLVGQFKNPVLRGRNDTFKSVMPTGAVENTAAMAGAETGATEAARAQYDLVDVPLPNGQTIKMPRVDALRLLGQKPQQQGLSAFPPDAQAAIRADMQNEPAPGYNFNYSPPQGSPPGRPGMTADPLAMEAAKAGIATQAAQNTDVAKTFANDYADAVKAEKMAPATIQKYEHLKQLWGNVATGKMAPTVQNLKAIAVYVAPDAAKEWTKDTPFAQAAQAMSNAMALELRNPAGGAGMPGSLSDSDRQYLQSMISSLQSDPRAIPMILDAKIALEKRNQDMGKIAREYRVQNGGRLDEGLYQKFQDYADTHPLFKKVPQGGASAAGGGAVDFASLPK